MVSGVEAPKYFTWCQDSVDFDLLDELFLCFSQTRRRGQCLKLHLQAEITLAKFFQAQSLQKFCLTLSTCMITSPVPTSCMVCPVEGSTLSTVFKCFTSYTQDACHVSTVLVASTVFVSTQTWPDTQCPESQKEQNTQKHCLIHIYQFNVILSVTS